ncbi:MAG: hypothetical protein HOO96_08925 [Polyangiaceae bacterium]|nr:hypothetical protein [Polyangiaceae bacterium]
MYAAEGRVYMHLARGELTEALAEVESWASWPLDLIGRWLVIEAYFQSQRRDFVPALERMLLDGVEQREGNIAQMEAMIELARAWPAAGE